MAIIKRINITEFKEVSYDLLPGLYEHYTPVGTTDVFGNEITYFGYEINDNPNSNYDTVGTTDFKGVIKGHSLLAKLEVFTVDTGNLTVQQFMQIAPQQAQNMFGMRTVVENIGWVDLGEALPSFYYEDCEPDFIDQKLGKIQVPGRLPVFRPFFSLGKLNIKQNQNGDIILVNGDVNGIDALQQIGIYNMQQNAFTSFGPNPLAYPAMQPIMGFQQYLSLIVNNEGISIIPGPGGFQNSVTIKANPKNVELQSANRTIIVDPSNPNYKANESDTTISGYVYDDGRKLRWSIPFLIVPNSFPAGLNGPNDNIGSLGTWESENGGRNEGQCIPFPDIEEPQGPTDGGDDGGPDIVTPDTGGGEDGDRDEDVSPRNNICYRYQINFAPYEIIDAEEINAMTSLDSPIVFEKEDTIRLLRLDFQNKELLSGYRDPRELFAENAYFKPGMLHIRLNHKYCTADVYPALRDKDGDIPEPIGAPVSIHLKNTRKHLMNLYKFRNSPLKSIGIGEDGYDYFSDGNSYQELLSETVIGCGDPISFGLDIPEIRVDIIENMESKFYRPFGGYATPYYLEKKEYLLSGSDSEEITVREYLTQPASKKINLHIMDLLYGVPSGDMWYNYPINFKNGFSRVGGKRYAEKIMSPIWQNVMYPIYDKLLQKEIKEKYKTYEDGEYSSIDNAISVEITDVFDSEKRDRKPFIPNTNWNWLLQKGIGSFTLNYTYRAGPNGLLDTAGSTSSFSVDVDWLQLAQFGIGIIAYITSLFAPDDEEIPSKSIEEQIDPDTYSGSEEEDRMMQSPRRMHKKGCVVLESKTGLYSTSNLPCPVIFLGYSDDYYNIKSNARIANIENLNKSEIIEKSFISDSSIYLNVSKKDNSLLYEIPSIKPRIKKYGRNPLLDIFYLNVVNPYVKMDTNVFPPENRNRYSQEKTWSNPNRLPFRSNRSEKNWHLWSELTYGEFPSIFPSHWQYNPLYSNRSSNWDKITDNQWDKKVKTTILKSEERWKIRLEYQSNNMNNPILVVTDNTPILDLYFGLMEMHVKGVDWFEIFQYVDYALSCVKNNNYLEWRSEQKTEIDLVKLEKLWEIVSARLGELEQYGENRPDVHISAFDFGEVKIQTDNFRPGGTGPEFGQDLESNRGEVFGNILIRNNTTSSLTVDSISFNDIQSSIDSSLDFYERRSSEYFESPSILEGNNISYLLKNTNDFKNKIPPAKNALDYISIPVIFSSFGAQSNYQYLSNISVILKDESNNFTRIESPIFASVTSDRIINSFDDSNVNPLPLPPNINFGITRPINNEDISRWVVSRNDILSSDSNLKQLTFTNYSEYDSILIEKLEIINERVHDMTDRPVNLDNYGNFKFFERVLIPLSNRYRIRQTGSIITPNILIKPTNLRQDAQSAYVLFAMLPNSENNLVYYGDIKVTYSFLPREDTKIRFGETKITEESIIKLSGMVYTN